MERKKISERISELASSRIIRYSKLEKEVGIYRRNVKRIVKGLSNPTLDTLLAIARNLNLHPVLFYDVHTEKLIADSLFETNSVDGLEKYVSYVFSEGRKKQQYSISSLAKKLNMDRTNYNRYEQGKTRPTTYIINRITEALDIVPVYLSRCDDGDEEYVVKEKVEDTDKNS